MKFKEGDLVFINEIGGEIYRFGPIWRDGTYKRAFIYNLKGQIALSPTLAYIRKHVKLYSAKQNHPHTNIFK